MATAASERVLINLGEIVPQLQGNVGPRLLGEMQLAILFGNLPVYENAAGRQSPIPGGEAARRLMAAPGTLWGDRDGALKIVDWSNLITNQRGLARHHRAPQTTILAKIRQLIKKLKPVPLTAEQAPASRAGGPLP